MPGRPWRGKGVVPVPYWWSVTVIVAAAICVYVLVWWVLSRHVLPGLGY